MKLVGRTREHELIHSMLGAGRHVLLEGPVGVGKTTLAMTVAKEYSRNVIRVDGDGRFTEQKLVGSFDPKLVLERGFTRESFIPGPLYLAMEEGAILLINELNRMPEMVQNVLLPALDDGKIQIPVLGELDAKKGFALIATQNPREFVATSPLSEALLDRLEWISISHLTETEENEIVKLNLSTSQGAISSWIEKAVVLTRLTREHPKVKRGASVRAAIALVQVLSGQKNPTDESFWNIAKSVLANRIELQVGKFSNQPYGHLLDELLTELKPMVEARLKKKP